ncbi:MAG: sugar ABC transporter permease [Actinomycetota bacterium]
MSEHDAGAGVPEEGAAGATAVAEPFQRPAVDQSFGGYTRRWWQRVRGGELGSLPIVVALIVITIVFGALDETFLTERNFTNLLLQMAAVATLAIGIVFVLLIGEIDLSIAYVSAVGGVVMTLLIRTGDPGWPWWAAILAAVAVTTIIGLLQAIVITKAGVPSFVVTLAGLLIWSGVVLILMTQASTTGSIRISEPTIVAIANSFLSDAEGYVLAFIVVGGFALSQATTARSRRTGGLEAKPTPLLLLQIAGLAIVTFAAVYYANLDRGVPMATVILGLFLLLWSFVASRTRFGRHVYAVGGNPEAARRAGIRVDRIRIWVFMINGFMAGVGGIMLASRLRSVATSSGGGDLLLNVIAAAVIGGTSLFGGVGRVVSALLGALVIASINSGMNLLGLPQGTRSVITGLVLLVAVLIDAVSKRMRAARGVA